eukprot:gene12300-16495_t
MLPSFPTLIHATNYGIELYLASDLTGIYNKQPDTCNVGNSRLGQLDIVDILHKDFKNTPLSSLYKRKSNIIHILSSRSVENNPSSYREYQSDGLHIDTNSGRKLVTVQTYLERIAIDKPEFVVSLSDEVSIESSNKRLTKAVSRSLALFSTISKSPISRSNNFDLFGVVIPIISSQLQINKQLHEYLSNYKTKGLVVGCAHLGESEEDRIMMISMVKIGISTYYQSLQSLDNINHDNIPLMIQGADSIRNILLALKHGINIISTNYPKILTMKGLALSFAIHDAPPLNTTYENNIKRVRNAENNESSNDNNEDVTNNDNNKNNNSEGSFQVSKRFRPNEGDDDDDVVEEIQNNDLKNNKKSKDHNIKKKDQNNKRYEEFIVIERCVLDMKSASYERDLNPL